MPCGHRWCSVSASSRSGKLAVEVFDLRPYFLPPPSAIWISSRRTSTLIWDATMVSGANALVGLVAGTLLGIAMSFLLMRFNLLNELLTPLAIALNAVPIFVLVAVFNNMFSITSEVPRRLMVTVVVYFIVLVNVARGLAPGEPDASRAAAVVRRQPDRGAGQGPRAQRRAVSVHGAQDRRARPRSSRPSWPSTSVDRRTGSELASSRTSPRRGTPSPGPTCSAPASSGWCST